MWKCLLMLLCFIFLEVSETIAYVRHICGHKYPAWDLHDQKQLAELIDVSMGGDYNNEEAHKFLKISLLCTQDMPKQRPSMSKVVKMLAGEEPADEQNISRPRLLSEFMNLRAQKEKSDLTSEGRSKEGILSSSTENVTMLQLLSGCHLMGYPESTHYSMYSSAAFPGQHHQGAGASPLARVPHGGMCLCLLVCFIVDIVLCLIA
ncbi:Kinase superfamily protein isoform 2 [Gossypium australe]|uniref:Kinase superfamily protein isoform 2 n=1 Tax=Gossypium australe TaxID=47621 RepID=A0A5B6VT57_9ROSI|nr:Kinase superfamily protein isoform 2 [Gossypium australe]